MEIVGLEDERLAPYRHLKMSNWTQLSGQFIAEGPTLVERLLKSDFQIRSVLVDQKYVERFAPMVSDGVPFYVVPHDSVGQLVGFNFHRGVLACGRRKPSLNCRTAISHQLGKRDTIAAVVGVQDPENLGGILRCCSGLGITRVLLGPSSADPFSRRVLRVSMGTAFSLQLIRSQDILADLAWLRHAHGVQSIAASLDPAAEQLEKAGRSSPIVVLFGNEALGLPAHILAAVDRQVRIDMLLDTDSLNVCMAAGIVLHYFCRIASYPQGLNCEFEE